MFFSTARGQAESRCIRSGELCLFTSYDDVSRVVIDSHDKSFRPYLSGMSGASVGENSVYITLDSKDRIARSFVWIAKQKSGPEYVEGGSCSFLDVLGPPGFNKPFGKCTTIGMDKEFKKQSIQTSLDKMDPLLTEETDDLSPEMKHLWSTIRSNQAWVAMVIARLGEERAQSESA